MKEYVLSIDQGTTGTTVGLIAHDGTLKHKVSKEFRQIFPQPGWVEHDPEGIWKSVLSCIRKLFKDSGLSPKQVVSIGITNQRETSLIWDRKTFKPVYNAIVWQCRRTTAFTESLKSKGLEEEIRSKTGLVVDPYFSASKFRWIIEEVSGVRNRAEQGKLIAGTIDSYLVARLSNGARHVTDVSNASRTQLFNIHTCEWDSDLLDLFSIPRNILPEVVPSSAEVAKTRQVPGLPDGLPISGIAGDQQAALFGQACLKKGQAKCTYGTGSFLVLNTGNKPLTSKSGLLTTIAWQLGNKVPVYALEGGAFICGATIQWLRDELKLIKKSADIEKLASKVEDSGGVEFIPAFAGLGAPYWAPNARGLISGLTRGTSAAHIARAALEAMAMQNVDILRAMENDLAGKLREVRVDGGASQNNLLMQMQADFLGQKIKRPAMVETTMAGAAYLSGLGVGFWSNLKEIENITKVGAEFSPLISKKKRDDRQNSWAKAISRSLM